jgi:hypothetical protein
MTKPIILRISGLCKSNDTIVVTLTDYNGNYIGLLHLRDTELKSQFKSGNINKIALIKDKEFISANNLVDLES